MTEQVTDSLSAEQPDELTGCARCGGTHVGLQWRRFQQPSPIGDTGYTSIGWATCPTTGEPIMLGEGPTPEG